MIGLDTNVLIRYLAQDDTVQSSRANESIERKLTEANPGFVSVLAIAEAVWVLERRYGLAPEQIAAAIERMLEADTLLVDHEQEVFTAMTSLKEGHGSFADALIGALGASAGCSHTVTFDQKALKLRNFKPL